MSCKKDIVWLDETTLIDADLVGGKGVGLLKLTNLGFRVPQGFIITTAVFSNFTQTTQWQKITQLLQTIHPDHPIREIERKAEQIQHQFLSIADAHPFWQTIADAYQTLGAKLSQTNPSVAVRSSAKGEDSSTNSFAGLYTSSLSVQGAADLKDKIKQCWSSLFTARALSYRAKNKFTMALKMAVIVQQMIPANSSGVMMTLNPINGDCSKIVIEATWGLGDPLVSSQITPDRFLIDKITAQVIQQDIALKTTQEVATNQGVKIIAVPLKKQNHPSLSEDNIAKLVTLGKEIEAELGESQDIEFSFQQDMLFLLQTRPETVWNRKPKKSFGLEKRPIDQVVSMMLGGGNKNEAKEI